MRLADIAKELRITTQELRHELVKTNFGISPTAHEVEDTLAKGIVRFLKPRVKPTLKRKKVEVKLEDKDKKTTKKKIIKTKKKDEKENIKKEAEISSNNVEDKERDKKVEKNTNNINKSKEGFKKTDKKDFYKNRSSVPKEIPKASKEDSMKVKVSRRIELKENSQKKSENRGPKKYYSKGSKNKKRSYKGRTEEKILTMMRHPHTARKIQVAKVNYHVEDDSNLSAEEIAMERAIDKEYFKAQKKNRAVGQKSVTKAQPQIKAKTGIIEIPETINVKEFSEKCGIDVISVIKALFKNGVMATINQQIDFDTAEIIAADLGLELKKKEVDASSKDLFKGDIEALLQEKDKSKLEERPPIVVVMGHVDHGKTKLLDYIRKANVVAKEAGGITQHIGAYQIERNNKKITFLDTPGHEAFTSMRARGAKVTDIAILVVAADEGVKPQTIEAINHAKEAGVHIIVAINKIDKPNANIDKVKGELVNHGLQPEDWGGDTIMAPVSAHTGEGVEDLLNMILLVAEMNGYKANPNRMAVGTVIESNLDNSLGAIATILINTGTLHISDSIVVGNILGKVKTMKNDHGLSVRKALPSGAVRISGFSDVPKAGDIVQAFKNEKIAKEKLSRILDLEYEAGKNKLSSMLEQIVSKINSGDMKYLKVVLKADTKGSLEAITQALQKIKSTDVEVKVIHSGVGNISNTDVTMASASQALLIGFHVSASAHIVKVSEKEHVDIKMYTIIYKLTEDLTAILSGMLEPEINIIELGTMEVKQIFLDKKKWMILGCHVKKGKVLKDSLIRVLRDDEILFESKLDSLKLVKEDMNEIEAGSECGIQIKTPKAVLEGDILEVFKIEKIERTLD